MLKNITIIVLALLLAASTYYLGYLTGTRRQDLLDDARYRIIVHDELYHLAEQGNVRKIQSDLGMVLLGEVRAYQHEFGDETGTNSFARHFADAKAIVDHVESTLVPISAITNGLPPNTKVTVETKAE